MNHTERTTNDMTHGLALVAAVAIMAAVFVLDLFTPLHISVWLGYFLPIWYLSRLSIKPIILMSIAMTCTALLVVGYLLSPPGEVPLVAVGNRMMGALALWIMTMVFMGAQATDERARMSLKQLQQSEEFNRSLMQSTADCAKVLDLNGRILLLNGPGMCQMEIDDFNLFRGKDWWSLWPQEMVETVRNSVERARAGETSSFEGLCPTVKGTPRWWEVTVSPVRAAQDGMVVRLLSVSREITDRKEAEHAIGNLAAIVTSSQDAIISKSLQGIVTSWNQGAKRLFGYTSEEMIGQPVSCLIPQDRQDEESRILVRLARHEPIEHYETIRRRKDGSDIHVSLTVSPVVDSHGRVIGASKIARDITEKKRAEEALRHRDSALTAANEALKKQTDALVEANKEMESFSYSVSHDLRAPLRTIDAFSRIMEEEHGARLDSEGQRCLTVVRKAAARAGELIDDLLEFSRLGRQGMDFRSVRMVELARESAQELRTMKENRKIHLSLGDLPPCRGDQRLLKLVWNNVLTNAFKYTKNREEALIEIGWMPDDSRPDMLTYFIKDNGVGFDMKYVHKLFGVFQRLHRQEDFEGSGVGLAIVQRIVHRHGGRVWAEGKVDGGATIFFSLRKA